MKPGRELDALIAEKPYKCRKCGNEEFKRMGGKRCCYICHKSHGDAWRKANPEKHNAKHRSGEGKELFKAYRKKWALKTRYNLTLEQYNAMLMTQNGVCLICNGNQSTRRALVVDHCHRSGKVRGLLCDPCNIGLANFRENKESLKNAITYLAALRTVGYDDGA